MLGSRTCRVVLVALVACLGLPTTAMALSNVTGQADFTYGPGAASVTSTASDQNGTGMEAESKLFYTQDGSWWGVLGTDNPAPGGVFLYKLVNHQWQQVLQLPGADPWSKADVLYDSAHSKLYISLRDSKSLIDNPRVSQLFVYVYGSDGTWLRQSGPTNITTTNPRNLTIALDSRSRLWTTFESGGYISVGHTSAGGTSFSYTNLPWSLVTTKDTSAVTSFGTAATGYKIGVMWDDTVTQRYMFAWRNDTDALGAPWHIETAYGGGVGGCPTATTSSCANYHISLRTSGTDVYAAIKLMSQSSTNSLEPMLVLVHRDGLGAWSASTVSYKKSNATRQILILAPAQDRIFVIAESQLASSGLFVWESSMSRPSFTPDTYSKWSIPNQNLHENPTSTKQSLGTDGLGVVESSQGLINQYWHNEFSTF
jgi:hypothetical protein